MQLVTSQHQWLYHTNETHKILELFGQSESLPIWFSHFEILGHVWTWISQQLLKMKHSSSFLTIKIEFESVIWDTRKKISTTWLFKIMKRNSGSTVKSHIWAYTDNKKKTFHKTFIVVWSNRISCTTNTNISIDSLHNSVHESKHHQPWNTSPDDL